jgi:hypothetical protein
VTAARPAGGQKSGGGTIETFAASAEEVAAGQPVTICYVAKGAKSVRIEPGPGQLTAKERDCVVVRPAATATYTLTVSDGARSEREKLTVKVK